MYSIDINLLRERTGESVTQGDFSSGTLSSMAPRGGNKIPMFIGMGVGALALLASGGGWWFLNEQSAQLEAKQKNLDTTLGNLKTKESRLTALNAQLTQVTDETQALAGTFNQIQPWSAILQDLRENIPQGVKIDSIAQVEEATKAAAPAAATPAPSGGLINKVTTVPNPEAKPTPAATPAPGSAPVAAAPAATPAPNAAPVAATPGTASVATLPAEIPTTKVTITGTAKTFDEVNNFVLTLKQSAFFNPDDTRLNTAALTAGGAIEVPKSITTNVAPTTSAATAPKLEVPKVVAYSIQTTIKRVPANALIQELERKGAVGLVTRLRILQQQQVIKQ
jgi:type IV pilus assembly protein PilN